VDAGGGRDEGDEEKMREKIDEVAIWLFPVLDAEGAGVDSLGPRMLSRNPVYKTTPPAPPGPNP